MTEEESVRRFGSIASIVVGIAFAAGLVSLLLTPAELKFPASRHEFWLVLSQDPTAHLMIHWSWALAGLVGLAVVPAVWQRFSGARGGWFIWATALAYLGYAVQARSHAMEVAWDRLVIAEYPTADPAFQQAVFVVTGLSLDIPDGILTQGGVGLWIATVSVAGLRHGRLPGGLAIGGLLTTLVLWAGVVSYLAGLEFGIVGLALLPIWHVWLGVTLLRTAEEPVQRENGMT